MIVSIITLFGTLNFYFLFKFNIYIYNQIVPISHWIVPTSHIMVLISHLMVPIEWVPYPQKECGYYRITPYLYIWHKEPNLYYCSPFNFTIRIFLKVVEK